MPLDRGAVPILEVGTISEALHQHLGSTHDYALHCPRAALSVGVVACTTTNCRAYYSILLIAKLAVQFHN